jgi:hypothetical protein
MIITTEEAELLAQTHDLVRFTLGMKAPEHDLTAAALRSLAAERDALQAERDMLKRDNEIMVGMINDMGTIFIKARDALGETQ